MACVSNISTHALTWRATRARGCVLLGIWGFLPTPSHGGRLLILRSIATGIRFLPTPSHGGRPHFYHSQNSGQDISTHALTWRATSGFVMRLIFVEDFYPRPHMEGDGLYAVFCPMTTNFYPRPHMEGDCDHRISAMDQKHFYPRPHMEGDSRVARRFR